MRQYGVTPTLLSLFSVFCCVICLRFCKLFQAENTTHLIYFISYCIWSYFPRYSGWHTWTRHLKLIVSKHKYGSVFIIFVIFTEVKIYRGQKSDSIRASRRRHRIPVLEEYFRANPQRSLGQSGLMHRGRWVFPGNTMYGAWCWPRSPS